MAVTLAKITDVVTESDGILYRGTPIKITPYLITIKITKATGMKSARNYPHPVGRKLTVNRETCDLYR